MEGRKGGRCVDVTGKTEAWRQMAWRVVEPEEVAWNTNRLWSENKRLHRDLGGNAALIRIRSRT